MAIRRPKGKREQAALPSSPSTLLLAETKGYERMTEQDEHHSTPRKHLELNDSISMSAIARLLRSELQPIQQSVREMSQNFRIMDGKFSDLRLSVERRLQEMENRMNMFDIRSAKLEKLCVQLERNRIHVGIHEEIQKQLQGMRGSDGKSATAFTADKRALTAVVGNLGTECISEAQTWLSDKLTVLKGPQPHMMCSKGDFGGMLLAEFQDQYQRDLVVTLLKTAGIQYDGKPVWAAPNRNPVERAARNFCFGRKRVFKVDWKIPDTVQVNDQTPYTVTVAVSWR